MPMGDRGGLAFAYADGGTEGELALAHSEHLQVAKSKKLLYNPQEVW